MNVAADPPNVSSETLPAALPSFPLEANKGRDRHLISCDEFIRAVEFGVFGTKVELELIEGELIEKVGENAPHASAIRLSRAALELAFFGSTAFVSEQHPIVLETTSMPEPDIAIVRGTLRDFDDRHPGPADILLLLEVSNTTLAYDRAEKGLFYARMGIAEYWILNLVQRQLEVYSRPQNGQYYSMRIYGEADSVSPICLPGASLSVSDMLPRP